MKITAVVMAGGKGERFWPRSRSNCPKQFLSLTDDGKTMIQLTVERLLPMVAYEDIFIATNESYVGLVSEQIPEIPRENILAEPVGRNTAPCIGLAAAIIGKKYDDAVMMVLPSDHLIKNSRLYLDTMAQASEIAQADDNLVTIGITPTFPETGYGYINFGKDDLQRGVYRVKKFVEKPDQETAKSYLSSGDYLWNSGMFVWKISTILQNFKEFLPEMYAGLDIIKNAYGTPDFTSVLHENYAKMQSISIDYGIMERAENIFTIPGNFGWDDVGSWLSLARINPTNDRGNMVQGDVITIDTRNSIICGQTKLISVVGLEDIVIVDTEDAILICDKDHTQDVKKVIENLKICNRNDLL